MSAAPDDVGEWARRLAAKAIDEHVRTLRRYGELLRLVGQGDLDQAAVRDEAVRFAREEGERYTRGLAGLTLGYSDALLDLERARNDAFFDAVLGARVEEAEPGQAPVPVRVDMTLSGPLGGQATGAFVVENRHEAPMPVTFAVSDFSAHGRPFRPPLVVEPDGFTLPGRSEQRVRLTLPLPDDLFEVGRYTATLSVRGRDDLEVSLVVDVTEASGLGVVPVDDVSEREGSGHAPGTDASGDEPGD